VKVVKLTSHPESDVTAAEKGAMHQSEARLKRSCPIVRHNLRDLQDAQRYRVRITRLGPLAQEAPGSGRQQAEPPLMDSRRAKHMAARLKDQKEPGSRSSCGGFFNETSFNVTTEAPAALEFASHAEVGPSGSEVNMN